MIKEVLLKNDDCGVSNWECMDGTPIALLERIKEDAHLPIQENLFKNKLAKDDLRIGLNIGVLFMDGSLCNCNVESINGDFAISTSPSMLFPLWWNGKYWTNSSASNIIPIPREPHNENPS